MNDKLISQLTRLNATGEGGFEGLIARLLEHFLGRKFYLARSGSQDGRDAGSDMMQSHIIAVECKRYRRNTELDEDNLQSKLLEAVRGTPGLDIWVLATSRDISVQLLAKLKTQGDDAGVSVIPLGTGSSGVGELDALCAANIDIAIDAFSGQADKTELQEVRQELSDIASSSIFPTIVNRLKQWFSPAHVGYPSWSDAQKQWLRRTLSSEKESRGHMSQILNVGDPATVVIPRTVAWAQLDSWLENWANNPTKFIITGDEGDGKTWSVASWINTRIQENTDCSPVLFLPSKSAKSTDPHLLLAAAISQNLDRSQENLWIRRVGQWMTRDVGDEPLIVLVLDGINERRGAPWWRELLENLELDPWRSRIAVIVTCRAGYWSQYFRQLRHIPHVNFQLASLSDQELSLALSSYGMTTSMFDVNLLPRLRKPRYLDRVVRHHERIEEAGDFTPARLVYEDWLDRYQRKTGLGLSDDGFREIIQQLAQKRRNGAGSVSSYEVGQLLTHNQDKEDVFRELETGGVLQSRAGNYEVNETLLSYGLGLLLAEEALQLAEDPTIDFQEAIESWLEPVAEMDVKAIIREVAALHSLETPDYPPQVRVVLLHFWVNSKNPSPEIERYFSAYFPLQQQAYFDLAELVWSEPYDNSWAQELILATLLRWRDTERLLPAYVDIFQRWLGFVHPNPYPFLGSPDEEENEKTRRKIAERVGRELTPGPLPFGDYELTVVEDEDLLRLGRVALAVISGCSIEPYIHSIGVGCLADTVMGFGTNWEMIAWVVRSARQPVWPSLRSEVQQLTAIEHSVSQQAAHHLLSFVGNEMACDLQNQFPEDLFPPNPWEARIGDDPCSLMREWTRDELEQCLQREEIEPIWLARKLHNLSLDPNLSLPDAAIDRLALVPQSISTENMWLGLSTTSDAILLDEAEPALAAFAPQALADMIRRIFRQVQDRTGMPLRQLAVQMSEHALVLGRGEWSAIREVWSELVARYAGLAKTEQDTIFFMSPAVLTQLTSDEQLDFLVNRPADAPDFLKYEPSFRPVTDWDQVRMFLQRATGASTFRRVLWFISTDPNLIPTDVLEVVFALINHEDASVRSFALKIAHQSHSPAAAQSVIDSGWYWSPDNGADENLWGSLLLGERGTSLQYAELSARVDPNHLGYALTQRGLSLEEVTRYADDIHRIWHQLAAKEFSLPPDFPLSSVEVNQPHDLPSELERYGLSSEYNQVSQSIVARRLLWGGQTGSLPDQFFQQSYTEMEDQDRVRLGILKEAVQKQLEAGNTWFAERFLPHALESVVELRPELVDCWIEAVGGDNLAPNALLTKARSFYEALCTVLLQIDPDRGVRLYKKLKQQDAGIRFVRKRTGITLLDYSLFLEPTYNTARGEWSDRINQSRTDNDLLEVTIAAHNGKGAEWIWQHIEASLQSDVLFLRARAYLLLGFSEHPRAKEVLQKAVDTLPRSWLRALARRSLLHRQTNDWAKHWFQRFLELEDDQLAWASFRLFLRCADRRFWHWKQDAFESSPSLAWTRKRRVFLENNMNDIENRIRKNEKDLRKMYLGQKVLDRQAWPWL